MKPIRILPHISRSVYNNFILSFVLIGPFKHILGNRYAFISSRVYDSFMLLHEVHKLPVVISEMKDINVLSMFMLSFIFVTVYGLCIFVIVYGLYIFVIVYGLCIFVIVYGLYIFVIVYGLYIFVIVYGLFE